MTNNHNEYHEYLQSRSKLGYLYRNFYLYPLLAKNLKGKVLDVGCGIGDFLNFKKDTVGVDINKDNIDYCIKNGLNAKLMVEDKIPFQNSSFDSIILDNVLEHILDPENLLNEINRVLGDEGRLIIGVPGLKGYASDSDHKSYYDIQKLKDTLHKFNFNLIKFRFMPINSNIFTKIFSQHCLYAIFEKRVLL